MVRSGDISGQSNPILLWLEATGEVGMRYKEIGNAEYFQNTYDGTKMNWKYFNGSIYATRMSLTNAGNLSLVGDLDVDGIITAKEFHTTFVSASIIYQSGSTQFGNSSDDIHTFTGNVGIGTSAPDTYLHVHQSFSHLSTPVVVTNGSTSINKVNYDTFIIQADDVTTLKLVERNVSTNDQVMTFTIGDNYGRIATTDQPLELYVNGTTSGAGYLGLSGTLGIHISTSGSVGIGTNNPTYKLHVAGNALISSGIIAGDSKFYNSVQLTDSLGGTTQSWIWSGDTDSLYMGVGGVSAANSKVIVKSSEVLFKISSTTTGYEASFSNDDSGFNIYGSRYGGTGKYLSLWANGAVENMRLLSDGNVGIGLTNPSARLHVSGSQIIGNSAYDGDYGHSLRFPFASRNLTDGTVRAHIQFDSVLDYSVNGDDAWKWKLAAVARPGTSGNYNSQLEIQRSTRGGVTDEPTVVFNRDGNVGIGTTSPSYKLDVSGTGRFTDTLSINTNKSIRTYPDSTGGYAMGITMFSADTSNASTSDIYGRPGFVGRNLSFNGTQFVAASTEAGNNWGTVTGMMATNGDVRFITRPATNEGLNFGLGSNLDSITRMVVTTGGNVGIGLTNPAGKLTVDGGVRSKYVMLGATAGDSADNTIEFVNGTNSTSYIGGHINYHGSGNLSLVFGGGCVGIGTNVPAYKLHVDGNTGVRNGSFFIGDETGSTNSAIEFYKSGTTLRLYTNTGAFGGTYGASSVNLDLYSSTAYNTRISGNGASYFNAGNLGIGTTSPSRSLTISELSPGANTNSYLSFNNTAERWVIGNEGGWSSNDFIIYDTAYRMVIKAGGSVGIGTTNPISALHVVGTGNFTGDVVAYYSSDKRLKDNLFPIPTPLEKISKITGYEFDWNSNQSTYKGHDYGVVAQEIESILPELVQTRNDGYKAVKYEKLVALLIESIKEQQTQINGLKDEINKLKSK